MADPGGGNTHTVIVIADPLFVACRDVGISEFAFICGSPSTSQGPDTSYPTQDMELHVRAVSARGLMDTQLFGTQDPFCKLMLADRTQRTRVHDNGGKVQPIWSGRLACVFV